MTLARTHPFGWLTPHVAAHCAARPDAFARYLDLSRGDWHYLGLLVALSGDAPDAFAAWADDALTRPRVAMLARVAPDAPRALVKVASRLKGGLWTQAGYRRLARLAAEPQALAALRSRRLARREVAAICALPPALRVPPALRHVRKRSDAEAVRFAVETVCAVRTDLSLAQVLRSLGHVKPGRGSLMG